MKTVLIVSLLVLLCAGIFGIGGRRVDPEADATNVDSASAARDKRHTTAGISSAKIPNVPIAYVPARLLIKSGDPIQLNRIESDLEYQLKIQRHVQLRAILNSPARDSEDFNRVDAIVQKYGFGVDLIPAAYSYAWERKELERRFPPKDGAPNPQQFFRTGMVDSDFVLLLERTYGRTSQELVRELQDLSPVVSFGTRDTVISEGEKLYE